MSVFWCGNLEFVFFGVKKSGTIAFLVSAENGAGVTKMTNIMISRMETLLSLFLFRLPRLLLYIVKHCCTLSKLGDVKKRSSGMRGELASTPSQILGQLEDRGDFPTNDPISLFLRHRHRQHGDDDDVIVNGCVLGALP